MAVPRAKTFVAAGICNVSSMYNEQTISKAVGRQSVVDCHQSMLPPSLQPGDWVGHGGGNPDNGCLSYTPLESVQTPAPLQPGRPNGTA
jgi:hypothetical protein